MSSLVSICVPNRNTRQFLDARRDSILAQTHQNFEVIVVDDGSIDGAREFFEEWALCDPRVRVYEGPGKGLYPGWNAAIERARGEYVYIATSDDTMAPECLERMVAALETHRDCDMAHCSAIFIDEAGQPLPGEWERWPAVKFFGTLISNVHLRAAGHDTVLAFFLRTPYFSMTQLLIRRSLFQRCGYFKNCWGSFGDLEWQMRATLVTSTVHVPLHLATWRKHAAQATQMEPYYDAIRAGWFVEIADSILGFSRSLRMPGTSGLPSRLRNYFLFEHLYALWTGRPGCHAKACFIIDRLGAGTQGILWFLLDYLKRKIGLTVQDENSEAIRREIATLGIPEPRLLKSAATNIASPK